VGPRVVVVVMMMMMMMMIIIIIIIMPSYVDPFHYGMTSLHVADGDGLLIWRVGKNILHKQSQTTDKGWFPILPVGRGANNYSP
jgi:hypothetical protein